MINGQWLMVKSWIKRNKKEVILLGLILLVGAILRLYKIADYMTFLGDEGRDATIVRRLLVNFDPILIGPGTSIGNMYLGPLYYYLIAPALLIARFSPVGPSVLVALIGVLTIILLWIMTREWFPSASSGRVSWAALIAAGLYAVSPTIVIFSQSSWNPNIMPFFALLSIYSIWKVWKHNAWKWLIVLGISYAFVLQSHYLGILLAPTLIIFWLLTLFRLRVTRYALNRFLWYSSLGLVAFLVLMSPLVAFDARHEWRNFSAMRDFIIQKDVSSLASPQKAIGGFPLKVETAIVRLVGARSEFAGEAVSLLGLLILLSLFVNRKQLDKTRVQGFIILTVWLGVGLLGLSFYRYEIYDHYYGFFFPAPFALTGGLLGYLIEKTQSSGKILTALFVGLLLFASISNSHLWNLPQKQMARSIEVARKIRQEAEGQRFNLAVLAERNYEDGYKYFLEVWGEKVIHLDPLRFEDSVTEQLFVVCEKPKDKCDPTHSPKAEVANFGWSKIDSQWEIGGVVLYKLVHSR